MFETSDIDLFATVLLSFSDKLNLKTIRVFLLDVNSFLKK